MKNRILHSLVTFLCCSFLVTSCGKKEHKITLKVKGDTLTNTVVIKDIQIDTVFTELDRDVFVDLNDQEIKSLLISVDENTPNGTEILTFTNTEINYTIISGVGFSIVNGHLIVSDESILDYEQNKKIELLIEAEGSDDKKQFSVFVLLNDVVDISNLNAHFTFNGNLLDLVSGESMTQTGTIEYKVNRFDNSNFSVNFVGNADDKVLEWDKTTIDLNQDFSICFFGLQRQQGFDTKETIIAGYNASNKEVINVFFERGVMKVAFNGVESGLSYSVFRTNENTQVRTALIKTGSTFSLRVNNNGVSETVFNESFNEVVRWSFGAEKNPSISITNGYNEQLDNLRFYQKALTLEEYISVITVDF